MILSTITYFLLFDSLYHLFRYFIAVKFIFGEKNKPNIIYNYFTIIIPVFHEEQNIARVLNNIKKINYPSKNFDVIFVSTQREYFDNLKLNTIHYIDNFIGQNNGSIRISRIHSPDVDGNRVTQLNFALNTLRTMHNFTERYFIFIDADTIFDKNLLLYVNYSITPAIEYYQIAQSWFKNFNTNSLLMKGFSSLQTYKVFSEEIIKISEKLFPFRGKYFVGNGMVIRGSFFNKIQNFSNYIEDVRLGHVCSFLKIKSINVKNVILNTESAKRYSIMFQQTALWFFGCSLIYKDFINTKKSNKTVTIFNCWFKIFTLYFENIRWMLKNIFNVLCIVLAFMNDNSLLFFISCLIYFINAILSVFLIINNKNIVNFDKRQKLLAIIGSILIYPIYALGTFYGFMKVVKYIFTDHIKVYKTER